MMHAINPPGPSIPGTSQAMMIEGGRLLREGSLPSRDKAWEIAMASPRRTCCRR
jgi:hypothetical protein